MLLTTGAVMLTRKIKDERAKKKELKQGRLQVGSSDVALAAFANQSTRLLADQKPSITHTGTDIKFEDPNDVQAESPLQSPAVQTQDARQTSYTGVTSPVESEKGQLSAGTPLTPTATDSLSPLSTTQSRLRSHSGSTRPTAPSTKSSAEVSDPDNSTLADTASIASGSTASQTAHALRVKTIGADLSSGFPYHPALFDLNVHPEKWDAFTTQIVEKTKFGAGDYAKMWGAATATALTGAIATSVWVRRSMDRSLREDKVRAGLTDLSENSLGDCLRLWNEEYFSPRGLFVHLELSESAMKNPGRSKMFRKPVTLYSSAEDRERKREERKFVVVLTRLDEEGQPMDALREVERKEGDVAAPVELPAEVPEMVELPADSVVELPAESVGEKTKVDLPPGYVEMEGDNTPLMEKMRLEDGVAELPGN